MSQIEHDSQDTFGFFTKQVKEVQQKPFKKLAFLGIAWGIGFGLTFGAANFGINMYNQNEIKEAQVVTMQQQATLNQQQQLQKSVKAENDLWVAKIKKIPAADFQNFMGYLDIQQNFYDSRVDLVSKSLLAAQAENRATSIDGQSASRNLRDNLSTYKKHYEGITVKVNNIYNTIQDNQTAPTVAEMKGFMDIYNNYKAGLPMRNVDMEKQLHGYLFLKNQGNVSYNANNQIIDKEKALEAEVVNTIKSRKFR